MSWRDAGRETCRKGRPERPERGKYLFPNYIVPAVYHNGERSTPSLGGKPGQVSGNRRPCDYGQFDDAGRLVDEWG